MYQSIGASTTTSTMLATPPIWVLMVALHCAVGLNRQIIIRVAGVAGTYQFVDDRRDFSTSIQLLT
jgi:hypothetical protein